MYKYADLMARWDSRRKSNNYKPLENNTRLEMRGDVFQIIYHATSIVQVYPCDKVTINPGGWSDSPTTRSRIQEYSGVYIYTDNRTNGLQSKLRVKGNRMPTDLPYTAGLEFRNGWCLNPEICVDEIKTIKRSVVAQVSAKLKTLRALMTSMARIDAFDTDAHPAIHRGWVPEDRMLIEPTAVLASGIYLRAKNDHGYSKSPPELVEFAMAWLRKNMYDDMDAYDIKEIRHGNSQQAAA